MKKIVLLFLILFCFSFRDIYSTQTDWQYYEYYYNGGNTYNDRQVVSMNNEPFFVNNNGYDQINLMPTTYSYIIGATRAFYNTKLDIGSSFTMQLKMYFGNDDAGADGIVFVLMPNYSSSVFPAGTDLTGHRIGYAGLPNSFAVEFDTYSNGATYGDNTTNDHIALVMNGQYQSPLSYTSLSNNIEDGVEHNVKFVWEVTNISTLTGTLSIYFDNMTTPQTTYSNLNLSSLGRFVSFGLDCP